MTPTKTIARLVEFGPRVMQALPLRSDRGCCVLATAAGLDVLRSCNIDARPLSVRFQMINAAWIDAIKMKETTGIEPDPVAMGAWMLDTGEQDDPLTSMTTPDKGWYGHLVIHVPHVNGGGLIDLDLWHMSRPVRNLPLPDAGSFRFPALRRTIYDLPCGGQLAYEPKPSDRSWCNAKDWTDPGRRAEPVKTLLQAIRKGRL